MSILSTNVGKKLLETEFLIAICRPTGDKWQLKTQFLASFDPCSPIVKSVFDCCLPGVFTVNCSKIFNTFLFLLSNKMWVSRAGIYKMLV